jgi:hypothetical protein
MMQSIGEIIANIADSEGIANAAPSNAEHTLHNNRARNGPLHRPIQPQLPREESTGIGRFRIDAARVINNLNLDTSVPHNRTLQVPLQDPLQVNHTDQQQSNVRPVQMDHQNYFYVLMRMLRAFGATEDEAERWAVRHISGDSTTAASQHQLQVTAEAVRRISVVFPELHAEFNNAAPLPEAPAPADNGAPIVFGHGPSGATIQESNARFAISYPPRFKPQETNWFLWVPQVERFLIRVQLDPKILTRSHAHLFSAAQHATALSIVSEIAPERESAWFARLNFIHAHSAWDELKRAYAPRAELELQAKIEDLENIAQSETESIREWTLRLRRLVFEVQAMQGEHVVTPTSHKLKLLRIRPIPGQEDGFSAFIGDLRHSLHLKTVEEIESKLTAYEDGIQMQARLRPAGAQIWHTYAGQKNPNANLPPPPPLLPTAVTFKPAPRGHCYICFNDTPSRLLPHHMRDCPRKAQAIGKRVIEIIAAHKSKSAPPKPSKPATKKRGTNHH